MASLIETDNINAFYGDAHILHDVSLRIERGEVTCLVGRNGVGKSTTLKSIMGLVKLKKGKVYYEGDDITNRPPYEIFTKKRIGYVPEERRIFASLTVKENLLISQLPFKKNNRWNLDKVLTIFPSLRDKQNRSGGFLSGGEQQMLAIGRSLMASPDVILLDEPCEGLAPIIVQELEESIKKLNQEGIAILLVEQSLTLSKSLGERFYIMSKGKIEYTSDKHQLFEDPSILMKYMGVGF